MGPLLNSLGFYYWPGLWPVSVIYTVIIEINIGIDAARNVPTTFNHDFNDSGIKILSVSLDFMR